MGIDATAEVREQKGAFGVRIGRGLGQADGFLRRRGMVLAFVFGLLLCWCVPATAAERLGVTQEAYWDKSQTGIGRWKKVDHAKEYRVRLYESEDRFVTSFSVSGTKADFSPYIKDGYAYHFSVCAVPKADQKAYISGDWKDSEVLEAEGIGENEGKWRTYSQGKKYERSDKSFVVNQWELIQGKWYYFDQNGFAQTGWQLIDQKWYYLGEDGVMVTGWLDYEGSWYFLDSDGARVSGWKEVKPGEWYYMDGDGKMLAGTWVDGYQLDDSGKWMGR